MSNQADDDLRRAVREALRPLYLADIFKLTEEEIQVKKEDTIIALVEQRCLEARIDEIEYPAVQQAYAAGFGASEFESFLTDEERARRTVLQALLINLQNKEK